MISQYDINHKVSIAAKECSKTNLISVCFRRRACISGAKVRHRTLSVFAEPMPKQGKSEKRGTLKHPSVLGTLIDVRHSGESLIGLKSALGLITKLPRHSLQNLFCHSIQKRARQQSVVTYHTRCRHQAQRFKGRRFPKSGLTRAISTASTTRLFLLVDFSCEFFTFHIASIHA